MVDVKIKIALELIAIMILAAPIAIAQEVPPHLVISEVFYDESGTDNNEFCELYNPIVAILNEIIGTKTKRKAHLLSRFCPLASSV